MVNYNQRIQVNDDSAVIAEGPNRVYFNFDIDGDIYVQRPDSFLEPGYRPEMIVVSGVDNINDLGTWMAHLQPHGPGHKVDESIFSVSNKTDVRLAAISVSSEFFKRQEQKEDEIIEAVIEIDKGNIALRGMNRQTPFDKRVREAGLAQANGRSALMAQHKAGELVIYPSHRFSPIPVNMINRLGEWIIEGKTSLIKKSIFDI
jgi:hypothetical protein